ncbi:protein translocase subunit SecD [Tunturiibacter empetritectus]|uniref:Protein translocase subunit SecD n=1 Tax=Tunturiibacter lichenicola TaxID=2051959 RepID=A0A852VMS9_9BACT|nr:protein translocase subunit SecD [Edaphobacter lichenicola]NYF91714.1 preprotein translocase subunit SecD [Edaphobacter lichenicola]
MGKNLAGKSAFIVAVLVIFCFGIVGIPHGGLTQSIKDRIHLGLDLKGGTHLVLEVHVAEAIASATDRDVARLEGDLQKAGVVGATVGKTDPSRPQTIIVSGIPAAKLSDARSVLQGNDYSTYDVTTTPDGNSALTMKVGAARDLETRTLDTSIETIRERIDKLGVAEPVIQKYGLGENQILVELPGVSDPGRVEEIIQSTAKLSIHAVTGGPYETDQAALQANGGVIPPDSMLVHGSGSAGAPDQIWLLKRVSEVEGTDFRDAQPGQDQNGRPNIRFNLTTEAGDRFYKYTEAHTASSATPGSMAILLDNKVREVAGIQSAIRDSGEITGAFTQQQANDLSLMLRTGALPASISYLETRTVGPSLGAASIHQGVVAAIAGMLAVMIFMLIYYKGAGINADLALMLNLVILLGFMGFTGSTLTLPGIAGVILTIGMGVDSNVLIFERIREELRAGKTAAAAVQQGFAHAWVTIIDTHVTTIVSAMILFLFGSGPVRGFAVTLAFGLFANLFTAVLVSRVIFDAILQKKERGAALSI